MNNSNQETITSLELQGQTITITVGDGLLLTVPKNVPSNERASYLRALYDKHVSHPDDHWKGRAVAKVNADIADDVAESMDFMGSIVDSRQTMKGGLIKLYSDGYWAHGF